MLLVLSMFHACGLTRIFTPFLLRRPKSFPRLATGLAMGPRDETDEISGLAIHHSKQW
ncbi:MAG: hypothetical protein ABGX16_24610 [Pirellulales bacterium]